MDFIGQTQWWLMNPHDELTTNGYCLANPGQEYVIYSRDGGSTTVNLQDVTGDIEVRWLDPITGEYAGQSTVPGGKSMTLKPPFSGEWVLHIGGDMDVTPPAVPGEVMVTQGE
jgi:hypothetical protein